MVHLSDEAVSAIDKIEADDLKKSSLEKSKKSELKVDPGVTKEQLKKLRDENLNPVTKETVYPELNNLLEPSNGQPDEEVTENVELGGITFKVTYNKSDVNYAARLKMLEQAVQKIQGAGFKPPDAGNLSAKDGAFDQY